MLEQVFHEKNHKSSDEWNFSSNDQLKIVLRM